MANTPTLRLKLFGGIQITLDEKRLDFAAERAEAMLAYLALSGRTHGREKLADFLWDDRTQKRALSNLRSLLAQLPDEIKPYLDITRKTMGLQKEVPIWVDVLAFHELVAQEALAEALALYRGDFLEGVYIRESRGLDEWAAAERERLRQQAAQLHYDLAEQCLHQRDYLKGAKHGRALLKIDPFNEPALRLAMRLYTRAGQRHHAVQLYQEMVTRLAAELGVEPSPATTQIYDRVTLGEPLLTAPVALSQPTTPLVGREESLADIEKRLDDPHCRLLTLTGLGGAGKTRLSLAVAEQRRHDYLNGLYFVPLARVNTAAQLPLIISQSLGISLQGNSLPTAQILNYLRERELLLILDNVEHIVDEVAEWVQMIMDGTTTVQILATSRERLNLRQEWVVPVGGLAYPPHPPQPEAWSWRDTAVSPSLEKLTQYPAVALFLNVARRVQPYFADPAREGYVDQITAVVQLCQLVEGVPLALELAGAAMAYMEPAPLLTQLQQTLDALESNLRDMPPRHRSLRAVFENSWTQLSQAEQMALMKLAVFRRTLHQEAATAVAGATLPLLRNLVAKSLLRHATEDAYEWHEIIRQYAWDHLQQTPDLLAETTERHALYYLTLLRDQESRLMSFELPEVLAVLGDEQENILQAWQWAVQQKRFDLLDETLRSLSFFYTAQAQYQMAEVAFREASTAVAQTIATSDNPTPAQEILLARLQTRQAYYLKELSLYEAALALHEQASALAIRHDQADLLAIGNLTAGQAHWLQCDYTAAQTKLKAAIALARQIDLSWVVEDGLVTLGTIQLDTNELKQARIYYEEAITLAQASGNVDAELRGRLSWGNTEWFSGEYQVALATFQEVYALAKKVGNEVILGRVTGNLGLVAAELGDFAEGLARMEEALFMSRQVGDQRGEVTWSMNLGATFVEMGLYERAAQILQRAWQLADGLGNTQAIAIVRDHLGVIALFGFGQLAEAEAHFAAAIVLSEEIDDPLGADMTRLNMAWWHYRQGEVAVGLGLTTRLLPTAVATEHAPFTAETHLLHGHLLAQAGQPVAAQAAYAEALNLRLGHEQVHCAQEVYAGLAQLYQAQGQHEQALAYARQIADYVLGGGECFATKEPLRIYAVCARVLRLNGEVGLAEKVTAVGQTAYERMLAHIENRHLREAFVATAQKTFSSKIEA